MKLRVGFLFLATMLLALAQPLFAQSTNRWRIFTRTDGMAENVCVSVTLGASGNVLVRHLKSSAISVLDGYEITTIPGPGTNRNRVYESPGGQLWIVSPAGLQEYRDGKWVAYGVAAIAEHFQAGHTNAIILLPVRQGRVLVLLPDQLLQFEAEDPDQPHVRVLRRADQTSLGVFTDLKRARDGPLWIVGTNGFERATASARNLKPDQPWVPSSELPRELSAKPFESPSPDEISVRKIYDVAVDPDGAVWVATSDGLFRRAPQIWQADPAATHPARPEFSLPPGLPDEIAGRAQWHCVHHARNGDLWLGGANETAWRHEETWLFFSSTNQMGPENMLAFAESPAGRIWCVSSNQVWQFDGRNWLIFQSGLADINDLCIARDGTLWVATDAGIQRYTQDTWLANGMEDGLPADAVLAVAEDAAGRIVAFTPAGPAVFCTEADPAPPRTFFIGDMPEENNFAEGANVPLSFRGRDKWKQTAASRLLYSHRLDEREWSAFQEFRAPPFDNLPLGKHYFQVRTMDRNANIDLKPAQLEFAIVVPWYHETRLVLILSVALGVAVFFAALAVNRHRKLRLSYAEVEQKVAERTRELEIANRELVQSQKMNALGTLSAGIAHDFNNILSIIKGSAQIIEDNAGNPDKIHTRVDRIKTVVQQGAEVVEAMLGFSRSTDQPPAPCDLNAVVDETQKLLGDRFLREVEVRFERGIELPEISVAKDFVQQILLNFIFNAAEAMERRTPTRPEAANQTQRAGSESHAPQPRKLILLATNITDELPPELALTPARAYSYVLISVQDSGSGIAPDIKPRIFEPFFTTKALSTKRGTGLGLSMVYELAKKMEAGLAVESVVGQGSTFTLIIPVREQQPAHSIKP